MPTPPPISQLPLEPSYPAPITQEQLNFLLGVNSQTGSPQQVQAAQNEKPQSVPEPSLSLLGLVSVLVIARSMKRKAVTS